MAGVFVSSTSRWTLYTPSAIKQYRKSICTTSVPMPFPRTDFSPMLMDNQADISSVRWSIWQYPINVSVSFRTIPIRMTEWSLTQPGIRVMSTTECACSIKTQVVSSDIHFVYKPTASSSSLSTDKKIWFPSNLHIFLLIMPPYICSVCCEVLDVIWIIT